MQDHQLYQQLLDLTDPWFVKQVTLKRTPGEVEVIVGCHETLWGCPTCGQRMQVHDHETRRWRHLDSCQFKTIIVSEVPRVKCEAHGTQFVTVPWAEKFGRFTKLFERFAIDVLMECSISAASDLLRVSWAEADGIKQRAVERGQSRKQAKVMTRLCVDEKSIGRRHRYATVVISLPEGQKPQVEYVGEDRRQESLNHFWEELSAEQKAGIEAIAMDMWEPFLESTRAHVPEAENKIAHDPFHLVRYMNEAVNEVRKEEHRTLMQEKDDRLAGSRFDWLYGMENLPEKAQERFKGLSRQILKTARAWRLKETFRCFWWLADRENAERYFKQWYQWAVKSRWEPVKKVAKMFQRHLNRILNYFQHRLTNGPIEGINNKIASLIKKAYGYRSFLRFRNDVLFHLGGLDLYPGQ